MPFWKPTYQRYVEPFAGSATLFFAINPTKALLADLNDDLIATYGVLKKNPQKLHRLVASIPRNKKTYLMLRAKKKVTLSKIERAARFIYLNRFCFNGIYRTNKSGDFNVPYAPNGTGQISSLEHFHECAESLERAELRQWDFGVTLSHVRKGDFVYLDPPYAVEDRRVFCEYGPKTFGKRDLNRLSAHLERINLRGAAFLLSYADCTEARQIFKKWKTKRMLVSRNIAGFSSHRRHAYELLVTNMDWPSGRNL